MPLTIRVWGVCARSPSGCPLLLYEDTNATAAVLTGARLNVYEWEKSQKWWESELGWTTLRWNSNVHREASLTVTLGPTAPQG